MKILHVTPSFYPATYWGGPILSTLELCDELSKVQDVELRVLTTDTCGPASKDRLEGMEFPTQFLSGYTVYYCRKTFGREFSVELLRYLIPMVKWADVVHLTYTYSPPTIPTLFVCRLIGRPVAWSPRGAMQRWGGTTRPIIKWVWEVVCNALITRKCTVLHVTSTEEAQASSIRIPKAETALIPNGVSIPPIDEERNWKPNNRLRIMYLGRLHPIKGIENLLEAMALLKRYIHSSLAVYGSGVLGYQGSLERQVIELGVEDHVVFHGSVSGEAKEAAFSSSDVCVVPSFTENFGMVVAEALAHGIPVIASKDTPWNRLEDYDCGMWVDNTPDVIALALRQISDENLEEMGDKGRKWMQQEFSWVHIANQMYELYESMVANCNS